MQTPEWISVLSTSPSSASLRRPTVFVPQELSESRCGPPRRGSAYRFKCQPVPTLNGEGKYHFVTQDSSFTRLSHLQFRNLVNVFLKSIVDSYFDNYSISTFPPLPYPSPIDIWLTTSQVLSHYPVGCYSWRVYFPHPRRLYPITYIDGPVDRKSTIYSLDTPGS